MLMRHATVAANELLQNALSSLKFFNLFSSFKYFVEEQQLGVKVVFLHLKKSKVLLEFWALTSLVAKLTNCGK